MVLGMLILKILVMLGFNSFNLFITLFTFPVLLAVLLGMLPDLSDSTGEACDFKTIILWNLDILFLIEFTCRLVNYLIPDWIVVHSLCFMPWILISWARLVFSLLHTPSGLCKTMSPPVCCQFPRIISLGGFHCPNHHPRPQSCL